MSELLLVCVPGVRIEPSGGLLRVVIVPRLSGAGGTLAAYGMADWPTVIGGARFSVSISASADALDLPVHSDGSLDVWHEFFPAGATVREWGGQRTYEAPTTDPSAAQSEQIEHAYGAAAVGMGTPGAVNAAYDGLALPASEDPDVPYDPSTPTFTTPDFHQTVALLREHPNVLRALGLIVDLRVPESLLAEGSSGEISVAWPNAPAGLTVVGPRTSYEVVGRRFIAASTPTHRHGVVDLTTGTVVRVGDEDAGATELRADWIVTSLDVKAGASRIASALDARAAGETPPLPGLQSAGLSLLRRGLGTVLAERAARGRSNAGAAALPPLTADDLVLGYRLDVRRGGSDWYPLCKRLATYRVNGRLIGVKQQPEESHIRASAAARGTDGVLRADETVARWDDWSLAVPRPAYLRPAGRPAPTRSQPLPYDFDWTFVLDPRVGPLPILRFGRTYDLRLRVADIAGGGVEVDDRADDALAAVGNTFGRHDPVPPPEMPPPDGYVVATAPQAYAEAPSVVGPGGAHAILVIRSDPNADPALPAMLPYPANDRRTLLPPPTTQAIVRHHAVLATTGPAAIAQGASLFGPPTVEAGADGAAYAWLPDPAAEGVAVVAVPAARRRPPTPVTVREWGDHTWPSHPPKSFLLRPGAGPSVAVAVAAPDRFEIAVPPGQEATLQISSSLTEGFLDQMAAGLWIVGVEGGAATAAVGRHPMITPPREVRVVHAVRRPLGTPSGTLVADRAEGSTAASVHGAGGSPFVGVDTDSTAHVGVRATWKEWGDAPAPEDREEVLDTIPVSVDDEALTPVRHEFADTKHREVTYHFEAHSRFRQFFATDEPDAAFVTSGSVGPVTVPSTARPAPLRVRSVVPAFGWRESRTDETLTRTRHGRRLRVELDRPWNTTGEGESLAVVLAPPPPSSGDSDPFTSPPDTIELTPGSLTFMPDATAEHPMLFTSLFRDPAHASASPTAFPVAATAQPDGSESVPNIYPDALDRDSGVRVHVAAVPVWFAEDRWWADIVLQEPTLPGLILQPSYSPFVRLALARYQPSSLPDLELSPIVTTELVPLLPDRVLEITQSFFGPTVRLSGLGPADGSHRVEAHVELRNPTAGDGTLSEFDAEAQGSGWTRLQLADGSPAVRGALGDGMLLGHFDGMPADGAYRLVVREIEDAPAVTDANATPLHAELASRSLFVDTVPLRMDPQLGLTPLGVDG